MQILKEFADNQKELERFKVWLVAFPCLSADEINRQTWLRCRQRELLSVLRNIGRYDQSARQELRASFTEAREYRRKVVRNVYRCLTTDFKFYGAGVRAANLFNKYIRDFSQVA